MTQFLISLAVDDAALALQWKCDCSVLRSKQTKGSPYQPVIEALGNYPQKKFYNVSKLGGAKYDTLPYSIRVLFESSIRNCDGFLVKETDAMNILDWKTKQNNVEVPFCPARVVLQDFTGIPAMVDFAAMREAVRNAGGDPMKVNPACPTDLTVDHSLQIDFSKW